MTWEDRLKGFAYTSPSGVRVTADYEDLQRSGNKRGNAYEFPSFNGSLVVDSGTSGRRYPMRLFFWGDNHDLLAEQAIKAIEEPGVGTLEHPVHGLINVVPLGEWSENNDLKTGANQTILELTFFETTLDTYPSSVPDLGNSANVAIEDYTNLAASNFAEAADPSASGFRAGLRSTLDVVEDQLDNVARATDEVDKEFKSIQRDIDRTLKVFVNDPLTLGYQVLRLIQAPALAAATIEARLKAAGNLLTNLIGGTFDASSDLVATSSLSMAAKSVINNKYETKADALNSAAFLLESLDSLVAWREANLERDVSGVYESLQSAIAITSGYLVQISFTLKQERRVILERPRNVLELCAELLGGVDELDFFIKSNDLSGSEYFELDRGREIVYYV